jgi:hypothetical protein
MGDAINPAKKLIRDHRGLAVSVGAPIVTGIGAIAYPVWSGIVGSMESFDGHRIT